MFGLPAVQADAADDWHLVLHAHSWHASHPPGTRWNEDNWGLGLRRELGPDWAWQVGAYRDSLKKTSTYVLADWTPWRFDSLVIGGGVGLITGGGYEDSVKPAAELVVRYQLERLSATIRVFPKPPPRQQPWAAPQCADGARIQLAPVTACPDLRVSCKVGAGRSVQRQTLRVNAARQFSTWRFFDAGKRVAGAGLPRHAGHAGWRFPTAPCPGSGATGRSAPAQTCCRCQAPAPPLNQGRFSLIFVRLCSRTYLECGLAPSGEASRKSL
jgi:hypothetical protein